MDRSGAAAWMLLASVALPALIGAWEAWRRGRGLTGWLVNIVVTVVAGFALAAALIGYAHTLGLRGEIPSAIALFAGLAGGSLLALWLVNRFR